MAAAFTALARVVDDIARLSKKAFKTVAEADTELKTLGSELSSSNTFEGALKKVVDESTIVRGADETSFVMEIGATKLPLSDTPKLMSAFRRGELSEFAQLVGKSAADLGQPSTFRTYARSVFPDGQLADRLAREASNVPQNVTSESLAVRPTSAADVLVAADRDRQLADILDRLAKRSSTRGGRITVTSGAFLTIVITGATVYAVAEGLHQAARRSAGCWRVYIDRLTGTVKTCKLQNASCRAQEYAEGQLCTMSPKSFSADMCRDVTGNCAKCNPAADVTSPEYLPRADFIDPTDMYVCRDVASIGEMLGNVVANVPDIVSDITGDISNTVSSIWNNVKYFVYVIGGLALVALLGYAYFRYRKKGGKSSRDTTKYRKLVDDVDTTSDTIDNPPVRRKRFTYRDLYTL